MSLIIIKPSFLKVNELSLNELKSLYEKRRRLKTKFRDVKIEKQDEKLQNFKN